MRELGLPPITQPCDIACEGAGASSRLDVNRANIRYHAAMAESYDRDQPHFKPENVEKVVIKLLALGSRFRFDRLLDIGCGTGFVTRLAQRYFKETVGVDLTREMLRLAPRRPDLILGDAHHLPLRSERFNVVTAYSVLHHLENIEAVASEAYRVLKWHGCFWSALDPNSFFFSEARTIQGPYPSSLLEREVRSVTEVEKVLAEKYGLDKETVQLAELYKLGESPGLFPASLKHLFTEVGFSSVEVTFDWFLGQGEVLHEKGEDTVDAIDAWLREVLPLSAPLYKYLEVTAVKT